MIGKIHNKVAGKKPVPGSPEPVVDARIWHTIYVDSKYHATTRAWWHQAETTRRPLHRNNISQVIICSGILELC